MPTAVYDLITNYSRIILVAGSIGAYFCMNAGIDDFIESAYFISPIVNFERLIVDMISWAATSEKELEKRKVILVDFGDDSEYPYAKYHKKYRNSAKKETERLQTLICEGCRFRSFRLYQTDYKFLFYM